jgi:hypothetical protein
MNNDKRLEDFMKRTEKDIDHIKAKVDSLYDFRNMILGGAALGSAIISALVSIAFIYFGVH